MSDKFVQLAQARNRLRASVQAWMTLEGARGNFRTNDQAPDWVAYNAAEQALGEHIAEQGTGE